MEKNSSIKITECPRDAMQGIIPFIPTYLKIKYLKYLLRVGFDVLDFGSFVSPKAIPQLIDTAEVVKGLDMSTTNSKLLAIVVNMLGAKNSVQFDEISVLGFPFSVSPTFSRLNINATIDDALVRIEDINNLCVKNNKELLVYFSMAFGNPYGDELLFSSLVDYAERIKEMGIKSVSLADTVGFGKPDNISYTFSTLIKMYPEIEFGLHLHAGPMSWKAKLDAAYKAGCRQFDSGVLGLGGCPMSDKKLVGNLGTEDLVRYLEENNIEHFLNIEHLKKASKRAEIMFDFNK